MSRAADLRPEERPDVKTVVNAELDLCELIQLMECIDWRDIPTISTLEAAVWTTRLDEARDAIRDQAADRAGEDEHASR